MSDIHNKLQYRNNYNHWKILDLVLDLNYFSSSNPNPNPASLPIHQTLSPTHQFSQRIWYAECLSVHGVKSEMSQARKFAWHWAYGRCGRCVTVAGNPLVRLVTLFTSLCWFCGQTVHRAARVAQTKGYGCASLVCPPNKGLTPVVRRTDSAANFIRRRSLVCLKHFFHIWVRC